MYQCEILALAQSMGVHPADVLMFAQSVANSIEQDGIADFFTSADVAAQGETAVVYAQHACKKFASFQTTYMVNSQAREAFQLSVMGAL